MKDEKAAPADVQSRLQESQEAAKALAKDAAALSRQAQALTERARQARQMAQRLRAQRHGLAAPVPALPEPDALLTVMQACAVIGVCERTLRHALREPALSARVQHETRRAGTFHKLVMLLPPNLVAELAQSLRAPKADDA